MSNEKLIKLWKSLLKVLEFIFLIILSIVLAFVGVFSFPFCIPFYVLRIFVKFLARVFNPQLGKMLTTQSVTFGCDDFYTLPKTTIVATLFDKSNHTIFNYRHHVQKTLIDGADTEEMKQYVHNWLGFLFWKNESNFAIEDHCGFYSGEYSKVKFINREILGKMINELLTKPFENEKSPWEILYVPPTPADVEGNSGNTISIVFIRFHHSMTDGFSLIKIMLRASDHDEAWEQAHAAFRNIKLPAAKSRYEEVTRILRIPFVLPYEFAELCLNMMKERHGFYGKVKDLKKTYNLTFSAPIPIEYVKGVKELVGGSVTAILYTAFTGALRSFMVERGMKVKGNIHVSAPLPMPGHPSKLRNFASVVFLTLPLELECPLERLEFLESQFKKKKKSPMAFFSFKLASFAGALPVWLLKPFLQASWSTIISSVPGASKRLIIAGSECEQVIYTNGLGPGRIGISLSISGYGGFVTITLLIDDFFTPHFCDVDDFTQRIIKEIELLKKLGEEKQLKCISNDS